MKRAIQTGYYPPYPISIYIFYDNIRIKGDAMAKDGTNRGGARVGAGKKKQPLFDKITSGKAENEKVMLKPAKLDSKQVPKIKDFAKELQADGSSLQADSIFDETVQWLKERSCDQLVSRQLIEQYAVSAARWIHCESMVSHYGYISEHPTTGNAIASPYVSMSQSYLKEANCLWQQIFQIVKENCSEEYGTQGEDMMEILLRRKSK